MKRFYDLREYIDFLKEAGELQEIVREVDWNLEIGAVIRRAYDLRAPAPLFTNIKDDRIGGRVLGGSAGLSPRPGCKFCRIAASLGLPPTSTGPGIVNTLAESFARKGVPPRVVDAGDRGRKVLTGEDIDLTLLPVPYLHGGDGGRYINTWGTVVVRTPDGSWTNWSIARIMLLGKDRMTGLIPPQQHLGIIHKMWADRGEPTPFALVLGAEPAVPFFSGTPVPKGVSEEEVMGAHFGEPVDVARCSTVDLHVPATAEIVIEGVISAAEKAEEGPMGEFAGYLGEHDTPQPVFNVTAMSYRDDPVLPVVVAGVPVEDTQTCCGVMYSAEILRDLRDKGFPADSCFLLLESAAHMLVVTVMDMAHTHVSKRALAREARDIIFGSKGGVDFPKVMLVDNDVDPSNSDQVMWAFGTRCHPQTDAHYYTHEKTIPLIHYLNAAEKKDMSTTKVVFDALLAGFDRSKIASFKYGYPDDIKKKVLENWNNYGYGD